MTSDSRGQRGPGLAYLCPSCRREITFAWVEHMGRIDGDTFVLTHQCACSPLRLFSYRCEVDHSALRRLLGGLRPVLPYQAAPGGLVSLRPEMERSLIIFRWELSLLSGAQEFELWCTRPPL